MVEAHFILNKQNDTVIQPDIIIQKAAVMSH